MGSFITDGLYNSEVNNYVYFGGEPDVSKLNLWGHFSQIVWKGSTSVGCYTADCSSSGLQNAGPPIPPYFTVCNYAPPGEFDGINVSIHFELVFADSVPRECAWGVCGECSRIDWIADCACRLLMTLEVHEILTAFSVRTAVVVNLKARKQKWNLFDRGPLEHLFTKCSSLSRCT